MKQEAEQMSIFDQDLWCGKTSPELSAQTEEKISERCCTKRSKLPAITPPLFLCLETSGQKADASLTWTENGALLGEFSMRSFGEYPNVVAESHLSQILEDNPHPKYSLSAKACQGILRRAQRRGKELPQLLKNALEQQVFGTQNGYEQPTIIQGIYIDKVDTAMVCMATQQGGAEIRTDDKAPTLTAAAGMSEKAGSVAYGTETAPCLSAATHDACVMILENHPNDSRVKIAEDGIVQTLSGRMGTGGGNTPMILEKHIPCSWDGGQTSPTLTKSNAGGQQRMPDKDNFNAVIALDRASFNQGKNAQYDFEVSESGINSSLVARGPSAVCSKEKSERERYIVRRLTPLECERLQGFPDFWTDIGEWTDSKGKLHKESSDSARYAALGNSIALPSWFYVLSKLSEFCEEKTMASLFDGISGFNVCWARIHGAENCLWSSEIEEFPIAVVKKHFGDEDTGEEGDFEKFFRRDEKENV